MKPASVRQFAPQAFHPPRPEVSGDAFAHVDAFAAPMREAIALARQVAASPLTTVLIEGETGTGKEVFSCGIHDSGCPAQPFVAINCAAIPGELLESQLFGHTRGAFTGATQAQAGLFEHAAAGTLFLDEVNQLPLALQAKLLRVLEDRAFRPVGQAQEIPLRCRIIAATNGSLEAAVAANRFRADLYFRLNVFRIELPPLRARHADIIAIAERFLADMAARRGQPTQKLSERSKALLRGYTWPGNVRELRNVIERATVTCTRETIEPGDLKIQHRQLIGFGAHDSIAGMIAIPTGGMSLSQVEQEAIRLTMKLTGGNLAAAARVLGVSRPTLMRKMRDAGLSRRSLLASS